MPSNPLPPDPNPAAPITALLVDDERLARLELSRLLQAHPHVQVVGECANADEALERLHNPRLPLPDLLFLDIQMPEKTGFEMLEELDHVPIVIFTTAYDQYALRAFEVSALDYLLKPISPERLAHALERATERILEHRQAQEQQHPDAPQDDETARRTGPTAAVVGGPVGATGPYRNADDRVFIKDGEHCYFVRVGDIQLLESVGNYVRVYVDGARPLLHKSLNKLEEQLDPRIFFRANRQFIINLRFVNRIDTNFKGGLLVTLRNKERIALSRQQAIEFRERTSL